MESELDRFNTRLIVSDLCRLPSSLFIVLHVSIILLLHVIMIQKRHGLVQRWIISLNTACGQDM